MEESKSWWASKTVWGGVIALVSMVTGAIWGVDLDTDTQSQLVEIGVLVGGSVGSLVAIYGRVTAQKSVK